LNLKASEKGQCSEQKQIDAMKNSVEMTKQKHLNDKKF
jgi:hypothetical protein